MDFLDHIVVGKNHWVSLKERGQCKHSMNLSQAVLQEINRSFTQEDIDKVVTALTEAPAPINDTERIQFAILKLAEGDLTKFDEAFQLANQDWRDLLVAAGLADEDWPDAVVAAGLADENWRTQAVKEWQALRSNISHSSPGTEKKSKKWWQFWK